MGWFDTGRSGSLRFDFVLTAVHAGGHAYEATPPQCQGIASASGPQFSVQLLSTYNSSDEGISYFQLIVTMNSSGDTPLIWSTFSHPIPDPPDVFNEIVAVNVTVWLEVRERKQVLVNTPPLNTDYDWLPGGAELWYRLHPMPDRDMALAVTSDDLAFNQNLTTPANGMAPETSVAPFMMVQAGLGTGGASHHTGLVASVTGVDCSLAPLDFSYGGFNVQANDARCHSLSDGIEFTTSGGDGTASGSGYSIAWPTLSGSYDGQILAWDSAYPGDPKLRDLSSDETLTATGGILESSFERHRFSWHVDIAGHAESGALNDHGAVRIGIDSAWALSAGENPDDLRIVLDDDYSWAALQLNRQPSVLLDALSSDVGWQWDEGSSGAINTSGGSLTALPTSDAAIIAKSTAFDLTAYRYIEVEVKVGAPFFQVGLGLGGFHWLASVSDADTWTKLTFDLAAPFNVSSFDDATAIRQVTQLSFGPLGEGVSYAFRNLRLVRKSSDHLRVLPPFRSDSILFHSADRRPGMTVNFRGPGALYSFSGVADQISSRPELGFTATAITSSHPYYNAAAPCAFLEDIPETGLQTSISLAARVRVDAIVAWAGMGDPSESLGGGGVLPVKFTKRVWGQIEGLCFIRDINAADGYKTTVRCFYETTPVKTSITDSARFFQMGPLRNGEYLLARLGADGQPTITRPVGASNRRAASGNLRAVVWDRVLGAAIGQAFVFLGGSSEEDAGGGAVTNGAGFYGFAVDPSSGGGQHTAIVAADDFNDLTIQGLSLPSGAVLDLDLGMSYAGAAQGTVTDFIGTPISGALVSASPSAGADASPREATTDEEGHYVIYNLSTTASATYDFAFSHPDAGVKLTPGITVPGADLKHAISLTVNAQFGQPGAITGIIRSTDGTALAGASILAFPDSDLRGLGEKIAVSGIDGTFLITGLTAMNYVLRVSVVGYADGQQYAAVEAGETVTVDFTLTLLARIHGSVRDSADLPIPDSWVTAELHPSGSVYRFAPCTPFGSYAVDAPEIGAYVVTAGAQGYVSGSQSIVIEYPGEQVTGVDFTLEPIS